MKNKILIWGLVCIAILATYTLAWFDPYIEVSPLEHDFGNVFIGNSSTTIVTISNWGGHPLVIFDISLGSGSSSDFSITSSLDLSVVLQPPNGDVNSIDVEIIYTPSSEGYHSDVLEISSNDPINSFVMVNLYGTGTAQGVSPEEQIANILAFFDESVIAGTLEGKGPGKSALKRLFVFRKSIETASKLIERGRIRAACGLLWIAYRQCDGERMPPDFIKGAATPELNTMILELIGSLGCNLFMD